ncbi:MAG: hypothetical protein ABII82_01800 [Verrucomicrobiota bacterium]
MNRALTILFLVTAQTAFAGDSPYFSLGPIGVGEISNQILFYLGDDVVRTPIPATREFLFISLTIVASLIAFLV